MELVAVVSVLALIEYFEFGALVGRERGRKGIEAPAVTGDPVFERYFRVHQNTLEQLVMFLPGVWLFGLYVSAPIAAGIGLVFVVARVLYLQGYVSDPKKRRTGALLTALSVVVLLLGGMVGAIVHWI
jgi:uncharacterized membrane protein YecN with MAPEG domain